MTRVFFAFLRRDILIWMSYRLAFFYQMLGLIGSTFILFFISNAIQGAAAGLAGGSSYFEFILVGIGFFSYLGGVTASFNHSIRDGQQSGTLEVILVSPHRLPSILLGSSGFYHFIGLIRMMLYFLMGYFVFNLWHSINFAGALAVIVLSALCFSSISLFASAFTLAFKRGDPILSVYGILSYALGGLLFPVAMLPTWLQSLSNLIPLTHALRGMRLALAGAPNAALYEPLAWLAALTAIILPVAAITFLWSINFAKDQGSLVQY